MNYKELEKELQVMTVNSVNVSFEHAKEITIFVADFVVARVKESEKNSSKTIEFRCSRDYPVSLTLSTSFFDSIINFARNNAFEEMIDFNKSVQINRLQACILDRAIEFLIIDYKKNNHEDMPRVEMNNINTVRKQLNKQFDLHRTEENK